MRRQGVQFDLEIQVSPTAATVNHLAAPPKNQTQFVAIATPTAQAGCAVPQLVAREYPAWSNPDPAAIQMISSASGTAVCKAPTNGPITLTGIFARTVPQAVAPRRRRYNGLAIERLSPLFAIPGVALGFGNWRCRSYCLRADWRVAAVSTSGRRCWRYAKDS